MLRHSRLVLRTGSAKNPCTLSLDLAANDWAAALQGEQYAKELAVPVDGGLGCVHTTISQQHNLSIHELANDVHGVHRVKTTPTRGRVESCADTGHELVGAVEVVFGQV